MCDHPAFKHDVARAVVGLSDRLHEWQGYMPDIQSAVDKGKYTLARKLLEQYASMMREELDKGIAALPNPEDYPSE